MPNKIQTIYVCSNCDAQFPKWSGRCLECGGWGTLQIQTIDQKTIDNKIAQVVPAEIIDLSEISELASQAARLKTGIDEIDRVLGNGLMAGSLVLLSGEPGIGKSTLVAQIAAKLNAPVIYASGEESARQIKHRFARLNINATKIKFLSETNVEKILAALRQEQPTLAIIDSIQTVYSAAVPSEAGSINQIRASAVNFLEIAKKNNLPIILIGHITKDGSIAGPKSLEHIVDTVIYLESETSQGYKILRATKNRFGSINELGILEMTDTGFREVLNPSGVFIIEQSQSVSGSVISSIIEGSRPFLVEVQALVSKTVFGYPQRKAAGFDLNRLQILIAVLTKRANINLTNQDVVLNIAGGLRVNDPSLDLAVCAAIASSLLNQTVDRKTIILGEVGLGGEVRPVSKIALRLAEAEKLGFTTAIIPDSDTKAKKIKLKKINNLKEVIKQLL
ncbi:DNA repair protein RadA [Candidatus Parcubacteria bacterium]|nr:DNA repair protein RadA [Candidatus Parcubacteria bacterium]